MKLLEIIPDLKDYVRIKRPGWDFVLVKSEYPDRALMKINAYMLQIEEYKLTYNDLVANDWEIVKQ